MSLRELLDLDIERKNREDAMHKSIYERLSNRMNSASNLRHNECIYTVPEYIPGYPLVNIQSSMEYLLRTVVAEGFIAFQIDARNLYVSWDHAKIRKLSQLKMQEQQNADIFSKIRPDNHGVVSLRSKSNIVGINDLRHEDRDKINAANIKMKPRSISLDHSDNKVVNSNADFINQMIAMKHSDKLKYKN